MREPEIVLVAGDWHGNTVWALHAIVDEARQLPEPRVILHAGDFGFWPGTEGAVYAGAVDAALQLAKATLIVAPGNHEDYDQVNAWHTSPAGLSFVTGAKNIRAARRGYRWEWHGRTWLACGGAASPDRGYRQRHEAATGQKIWWQQEYITDIDVSRCTDAGPADVLLSHDRPSRARIALPEWPHGWDDADHARCDVSREQVQRICEGTRVSHVIGGHYHMPFMHETHDLGYGPVQVTQLDQSGTDGNYRVLNVRTMEWQ
jgi:Calcineurin-like phosphoesterase